MHAQQYESLAVMIAESSAVAARAVDLPAGQADAHAAAFVAHLAWLLENSADDTFGGRRFNPYAFSASTGYPIHFPCTGEVDETTQTAADQYAAGTSLAEIAAELGLPAADVRARIVAAGVEIRRR